MLFTATVKRLANIAKMHELEEKYPRLLSGKEENHAVQLTKPNGKYNHAMEMTHVTRGILKAVGMPLKTGAAERRDLG